jgi:error-prone DNA polymerase
LRAGMTRNGISTEVQDLIVRSIGSFAAYGFPESHAASFALLAYASAYLKCHYPAAFTAAILNNQPMGFYHPATLVKDAQRHGIHFRPIDVTQSEWACTLEKETEVRSQKTGGRGQRIEDKEQAGKKTGVRRQESECGWQEAIHDSPSATGPWPQASVLFSVRLGFNYLKGFRREIAERVIRERDKQPFESIRDLVRRIPEIRKEELNMLAEAGALNWIGEEDRGRTGRKSGIRSQAALGSRAASDPRPPAPSPSFHRRTALWQAELAARPVGELLEPAAVSDEESPLAPMDAAERLLADYRSTSLTIGMHPMRLQRERMDRFGVVPASELEHIPNGKLVRIAGAVICRQRPGTASGFVFISLEDETGISNAIVEPDLFDAKKLTIVEEPFLMIEGVLQNQRGSLSVKAAKINGLRVNTAAAASHDFH